jgi:hypothetical protein
LFLPNVDATQVCEKVFVKKRKVFNITEARVAGTEAAKFFDLRKGVPKSELQQQVSGWVGSFDGPIIQLGRLEAALKEFTKMSSLTHFQHCWPNLDVATPCLVHWQARGGPASSSRPAGGRGGGRPGSGIAQAAGQKMSKWKMESEQLRAAMRANRMMAAAKARGEDIRNMTFDTGPEVPDDR